MKNPKRSLFIILCSLVTLMIAGWMMDSAPALEEARSALRTMSAEDVRLRTGRMGEQLRDAQLLATMGLESSTSEENPEGSLWSTLGSKQGIHNRLLNAGLVTPLESTTSVLPEHHSEGVPTISLWVDEDDLYHPERGIIPNWTEKWERDAQISYFEEGQLKFSSNCGIRLHGGSTRVGTTMERRGLDWRSFRLRFRGKYGRDAIPPGVVLPPTAGPILDLTVRGNRFLPQATAFDIARRVGNLVPATRTARMVLNGKPLHIYSLIDHTGRRQWKARLGHDNFILNSVFLAEPEESPDYYQLKETILTLDRDTYREEIEKLVDLDDYMRHMFVIMYCGAADWAEGSCFLDLTQEKPRWRWVHWDLDNSFRLINNSVIKEGNVEIWDKEFLNLALKPYKKAEMQARVHLFQRLVRYDPGFRYEFAELVQGLLNHEVSSLFVWSSVQAHKMARYWKYKEPTRTARLGREHSIQVYARLRPAAIRKDLVEHFGLEPARQILLKCAEKVELTIDERTVRLPYRGSYFPRFPIELEIPNPLAERFSHWLVEGGRVDGSKWPVEAIADAPVECTVELVLNP